MGKPHCYQQRKIEKKKRHDTNFPKKKQFFRSQLESVLKKQTRKTLEQLLVLIGENLFKEKKVAQTHYKTIKVNLNLTG